ESLEEKRQELAAAFRGDPLGNEAEEARSVKAFFDAFERAMRAADKEELADCFDVERMFQEVERLGVLDRIGPFQKSNFVAGMKIGLKASLAKNELIGNLGRAEIKRFKPLNEPGEAVVFVKHRDAATGISRM